ncbi:MAG: DUF3575 domain-containing protein [Bacteroidales bacterium]|jgi:hypothetical protein|nr:DUF3575 domain-containing protein [Bacteroidales bacterium]
MKSFVWDRVLSTFPVILLCLSLFIAGCGRASAQRNSVSTNILGYVNFFTLNMELSRSVSQHVSLEGGVKYNPFAFNMGDDETSMRNKQLSLALGGRYWPWHVYSGWWISPKVKWQMFNTGGIISSKTREGDRVGAGITAGYTYMLNPRFNLEMGVGGWLGKEWYTVYDCPVCGEILDKGEKFFILPNDIVIGVSYIF